MFYWYRCIEQQQVSAHRPHQLWLVLFILPPNSAPLLVLSTFAHLSLKPCVQSAECEKAECTGECKGRRKLMQSSEWVPGLQAQEEGSGSWTRKKGFSPQYIISPHPCPLTHSVCSAMRVAASTCSALRPMARRTCYLKTPPPSWCPSPHRPMRHGWAANTCMPWRVSSVTPTVSLPFSSPAGPSLTMGVVRLAGELATGGHTPQEVCVLLGLSGNLFLPPPCLSWLGKKHLWSQMAALYPGNPTCSGGWDPEPQGLSWRVSAPPPSICQVLSFSLHSGLLLPQCPHPPTMPPSSHSAPILPPPLPFLNPAWTSGSSQFMFCWSLAWRILNITLLACEMCTIVW